MLDKVDDLADKNPKEYWKLVNSIKANQTKKVSEEISSSEWFEYFKNLNKGASLHTEESSTEAQIVKDFNLWASGKNDTLDEPISINEIRRISKKLKNGKGCGRNPLSNEIIKLSVTVLPSYFVKSFNVILSKGVFPAFWSKRFIVPIYKTGNTDDPNNYRGICISSCLGKFFTLIMNERLNHYLEQHKILGRCQIGFRKDCRTADHFWF